MNSFENRLKNAVNIGKDASKADAQRVLEQVQEIIIEQVTKGNVEIDVKLILSTGRGDYINNTFNLPCVNRSMALTYIINWIKGIDGLTLFRAGPSDKYKFTIIVDCNAIG